MNTTTQGTTTQDLRHGYNAVHAHAVVKALGFEAIAYRRVSTAALDGRYLVAVRDAEADLVTILVDAARREVLDTRPVYVAAGADRVDAIKAAIASHVDYVRELDTMTLEDAHETVEACGQHRAECAAEAGMGAMSMGFDSDFATGVANEVAAELPSLAERMARIKLARHRELNELIGVTHHWPGVLPRSAYVDEAAARSTDDIPF